MKINNITNYCRKPGRFGNFTGNELLESRHNGPRYKHYEEPQDDILSARCIIKAHEDVKNSGKMRLYKAIPAISSGIIATGIAIAQPGKLSAKVASGLGFLALCDVFDTVKKNDEKNHDDKGSSNALLRQTAKFAGAVAAGVIALKGLTKTPVVKQVTDFAVNEVSKFANELNSTKVAQTLDKTINPAIDKHQGLAGAGLLATFGLTEIAGTSLKEKLLNSMSQDVKNKASENYIKAKAIQQSAREHFNSIDAIEV